MTLPLPLYYVKGSLAETNVFLFFCCRDYKLRVFAFGDLEFLCKIYGLSGSSGQQKNKKKNEKQDIELNCTVCVHSQGGTSV